jgi:hypothetical protein
MGFPLDQVGKSFLHRKHSAKDAEDAKQTIIEEARVCIQNSVLSSIILHVRKQVFYFAPLASFAVRLYRA